MIKRRKSLYWHSFCIFITLKMTKNRQNAKLSYKT